MSRRPPHADPGEPDARGPGRYLWWVTRRQFGRVLLGATWGSLWMLGLTLPPYLISRAIDDGLRPGNIPVLGMWAAAVFVAAAGNGAIGMLRHRTMTFIRLDAAMRTVQVVSRQASRLGAALPRKVATGEVVNIGASDVTHIAQTLTMTGPGVGGVVAYVAVAALLLSVSPLLAAVVLLGVPFLAVLVGPLLSRLQRVETAYREQQGELTARAGDIVAGLRVLCGIGGKEIFASRYHRRSQALRAEGYRVGAVTSWIEALTVGLPALFLALVSWLAARFAAAGDITVGEMVAVYGYVAMLVVPVWFFIEAGRDLTRGLVAARRVVRVLKLTPEVADDGGNLPGPREPADLHDPVSGLTVPAGTMVGVATARPADAVALVDRLGRYVDSAVTWGSVPLSRMSLPEVRWRLLVADNDAYLFAGSLREVVTTRADPAESTLAAAVHCAAAEDIVAGLPDGLDSTVDAQGRSLSGGQRQRLRLVRALLAAPDVLLLVEPTSAVDAHTEAAIAGRVHAARRGRTTVVVATSPLLLDQADQVAYLVDGQVVATGSHADLLAAQPGYRILVTRGTDDEYAAASPRPVSEGAPG